MGLAIKIVTVGAKGSYSEEIDRYRTFLRPYATLTIAPCKSIPHRKGKESSTLIAEEQELFRNWPDGAFTAALAEGGISFTSQSFARWIGDRERSASSLHFIIGSAYGLSAGVKRRCDAVISLSPLTFPHQLCVLLLVEQVYRAFTILRGHPYHK